MPVDGTFPSGTAAWERRNVAEEVPVWRQELCIQRGQSSFVCPHSVIRAKYYDAARLTGCAAENSSRRRSTRAAIRMCTTGLQFYVEDCTGCGLCIEACPAHGAVDPGSQGDQSAEESPIASRPSAPILRSSKACQHNDRARIDFATVRGVQFLEPLFAFSGACAGCGETPYLKLLSQLFGDRMMIANATGCSSIYGGNLPVTPWGAAMPKARGPAWSNSLFEDNAEFGLGFRLAADQHLAMATQRLKSLSRNSANRWSRPS